MWRSWRRWRTKPRKAAPSSCSQSRSSSCVGGTCAATQHVFHKFSAQSRMSGVDLEGRMLRKGAADAIRKFVEEQGGTWPLRLGENVDSIARKGATPLVVADGRRACGVIELRDIVKGGIRERFAELRQMGIKTIMVTGDNRLTAAAIAAEAGVDDFLAEATPEKKLELDSQQSGRRSTGRDVR